MKKSLIILFMTFIASQQLWGQGQSDTSENSVAVLPVNSDEFITKVCYNEYRVVSFEMVGPSESAIMQSIQEGNPFPRSPYGVECLTIGELAKYHGYRQDLRFTEYVDLEGEILSEKQFLFEEGVRDKWMPGYSRIVIGKHYDNVFGKDGQLLYSFRKDHFEDSITANELYSMSSENAANYKNYILDGTYIQEFLSQLQTMSNQPDSMYSSTNLIIAHFDSVTYLYDHQMKTMVTTEYDWNRNRKRKETVCVFSFSNQSSSYYPSNEIITEWFKSEKGCCIRKMTVILRDSFSRNVNHDYRHYVNVCEAPGNMDMEFENENEEFSVSMIPGTNNMLIQKVNGDRQIVQISVYDLAGRQLLQTKAPINTPVHLPTARAGIYLIEIHDVDGQIQLVRQLIVPSRKHSF